MSKKILAVLSEWGYWGEELVGPYDVLLDRGYQIDFMTPFGRKPPALPPSMEPGFLDPPLCKIVTDVHYANRTREIHESNMLNDPINLSEWFPQMPYFNGPSFGLQLEEYYTKRDACWKDLEKYDALLLPGTAFTIEPGIYLPGDFGVRLEIDLTVHENGVEITTLPLQHKIIALL